MLVLEIAARNTIFKKPYLNAEQKMQLFRFANPDFFVPVASASGSHIIIYYK